MATYIEYDNETLQHLKSVELLILKDFIKICEENNLTYFSYGGTNIGAVRHQGFIPWDDDVDVIMFREDYEKFLDIMENSGNQKYYLINMENSKDYFFNFTKLCLKGTKIDEDWTRKTNFNIGINIDIFPFDYVPKNKIRRTLFIRKYKFLSKIFLVFLVNLNHNYISLQQKTIAKVSGGLLKILRVTPEKFKRYFKKQTTKYDNTNYVYDFSALMYKNGLSKELFFPPKKVPFEDIEINVPNNYHEVLTEIYGDYMKLPPEEDRYNHIHEGIDFGDY